MEIKITKSPEKTSVVFVNSNREFTFKELEGDAISKYDKMTFMDLVKTLVIAGKENDAVFIDTTNE